MGAFVRQRVDGARGVGRVGGGIAFCYVRGHGDASGSSTQDGGPRAGTGRGRGGAVRSEGRFAWVPSGFRPGGGAPPAAGSEKAGTTVREAGRPAIVATGRGAVETNYGVPPAYGPGRRRAAPPVRAPPEGAVKGYP
ncbi:hypothetical protein SCMC78_30570 [Streptomyces sp. CMC78]|uniref:Uncharacterized protein n=1 Tax=Streptomyces sp. CMC78 TaxID=3231512 RepID=A0AB33KKG1_9ACTN